MSENLQNDEEKRKFLMDILLKFEFVLPKGNKFFQQNASYLLPLLFPNKKPKQVIINDTKLEEIRRTNEWKIEYQLPFKPPSLWKMLFLKLRK